MSQSFNKPKVLDKYPDIMGTVGRIRMGTACECTNWAGYGEQSFGKHHHTGCSKYKTEKFPYLWYYEDAMDAWTFAPDGVVDLFDLEDGDDIEIMFKRKDMTDAEIAVLPED